MACVPLVRLFKKHPNVTGMWHVGHDMDSQEHRECVMAILPSAQRRLAGWPFSGHGMSI